MLIDFVEIQNYRKLKACRVDLAPKTTVLVGANNSGKTSAMDALIFFLGNRKKAIATTDFTLSNWAGINEIGNRWLTECDKAKPTMEDWEDFLPCLDIWLRTDGGEIHYISHLIPTLDWQGGLLGVRFRLEPENLEKLSAEFRKKFNQAAETSKQAKGSLQLWPTSLRDFLDRKLRSHFTVRTYLLDPSKCAEAPNGKAQPQKLTADNSYLEDDPFRGLIKVDVISAQRGFSDPYGEIGNDDIETSRLRGSLSSQLKSYYSKHLDPSELPESDDIDALTAISQAQGAFEEKMKDGLKAALGELETLGYPGFTDPKITISCRLNPLDSLNHSSAVQFSISGEGETGFHLPEKYNGLGYQNLISMVFKLLRFRDEWMRVGKVEKRQATDPDTFAVEPLHLVLIEEPEAHLHAQVQQVFIRKAYDVLRNHVNLRTTKFNTQLLVSTHSSHIAHEIDFACLRYFRREPAEGKVSVPCARVISLANTFGAGSDTAKFAIRYLKTTHCDLFFADAAILVEGAAERILLPHFIEKSFPTLREAYISLMEVGGSHAHRLQALIENLGIITLVVTDVDSVDPANSRKAARPETGKNFISANNTLKTWLPKKESIDDLATATADEKTDSKLPIRIVYQAPVAIDLEGGSQSVIPHTFEDAFALANIAFFKASSGTGMIAKIRDAILSSNNVPELCNKLFEAVRSGEKAAFALDLLFSEDPSKFNVPPYIHDGLSWVHEKLTAVREEFVPTLEKKS